MVAAGLRENANVTIKPVDFLPDFPAFCNVVDEGGIGITEMSMFLSLPALYTTTLQCFQVGNILVLCLDAFIERITYGLY